MKFINENNRVNSLRVFVPTILLLCVVVGKDCMRVLDENELVQDERVVSGFLEKEVLVGRAKVLRVEDFRIDDNGVGVDVGVGDLPENERKDYISSGIDEFLPITLDEALEYYGSGDKLEIDGDSPRGKEHFVDIDERKWQLDNQTRPDACDNCSHSLAPLDIYEAMSFPGN